jgi:hypothetical protein
MLLAILTFMISFVNVVSFRYFGEIAMSNQTYCKNCKNSHAAAKPYSFKAQCKQAKDPSDNKQKPLDMSQAQKDKQAEAIERAGEKCMSINQKTYMHYTLVSACTDSNLPPSGPGWFDHRTNVKLNLLTVDCRADTTCELWYAALAPLRLCFLPHACSHCFLAPSHSTGGKFSDLAQTKCMDCPDGADCRDGQLFIGDQFWLHTTGPSPAAAGASNSTVTLLSTDDSGTASNISLDENTTLYKCIHRGACRGDSKTALNFTCREGHGRFFVFLTPVFVSVVSSHSAHNLQSSAHSRPAVWNMCRRLQHERGCL